MTSSRSSTRWSALLERRNRDLLRIGRVVGREGRMLERLNEETYDGAWAEGVHAVNALIDDLGQSAAETARVIEAVAAGRPVPAHGAGDRGPPAARGVPAHRPHGQHDGRPALVVRRRGHPGGPRGRHRRAPRRAGRRARRVGHVARPHRLGEHHGQQPDRPGALDLVGGHRDRPGRPVPQDHRQRPRRGRRAGRDDQRADRHPAPVRRRGHPGGPRGGHGRAPRRAGRGARTSRAPGRTSPTRST